MAKIIKTVAMALFFLILCSSGALADRTIRVYGRITYERHDGTVIGADRMKLRVYDEDCWGACNNKLKVTKTDHEGYFDTSFHWGDPVIDTDPDIFVEWETMNGSVEVQSDIWEINFKWHSTTISDVKGTSVNMGERRVFNSDGDSKPMHVHNNITRTWRWLNEKLSYSPKQVETELYNILMDSHYNNYTDTIHLTEDSAWEEGTAMHEYGHFWLDMFSYFEPHLGLPGFACSYGSDWHGISHGAWCEESGCVAWQEGFPTWFADVIGRSLLGDYGTAPEYYYGYYYDPAGGPDGYENLTGCDEDGWTLHDFAPRRTEGFVAALLRDIEDANPVTDDHYPADVFADALELGYDEIFRVVDEGYLGNQEWSGGIIGSPINGVNDFLDEFRQKYPQYTADLWETAINVNIDIDEAIPTNPQLAAAYHSVSGESANPNILMKIWGATDDISGIDGFSVSVSQGAPASPPQDTTTNYVTYGGVDPEWHQFPPVSPGTYYLNARSRDRSGKWASGYASWGPTTIIEPGWYAHVTLPENSGGSWVDVDTDGDLDFFSTGLTDQIYRNNADGSFTPVNLLGMDSENTVVAVWGDMDNDGDQDVYLAKTSGTANKLYRNDGSGSFTDITGVLGETGYSRDAAWGDYDRDGFIDLFVVNEGTLSKLYHNNGDGTFTDVTAIKCLSHTIEDGRGVQWVDYDSDGDLDLNIVNVGSNEIYENDGTGVFSLVLSWTLKEPSTGCCPDRSVAWGDFDNDGYMDFYLATAPSGDGQDDLYRNDGNGAFYRIGEEVLGGFTKNSSGVAWLDFDNDGDIDLYLMGVQPSNGPFRNGMLFRNNGDGTFTDITDLSWPLELDYGMAWADFDGDGDLDLLRRNDLLRNDVENDNHWLKIELEGTCSNRFGIGARIRVSTNGVSQIREVTDGSAASSLFPSKGPLTAVFGLGDYTLADTVEIVWPSGRVQTLSNVAADRKILIVEPPPENDCDYDGDLDDDDIPDEVDACPDTVYGEPVDDVGCSWSQGGDVYFGDGILRHDTADVFEYQAVSLCSDNVIPAIEMDFDEDGVSDTMLAVFRITGGSHIGYYTSSTYPPTTNHYLELQPQYLSDDGYSRVKIRFVDMLAPGFKSNDISTWSYKRITAVRMDGDTGGNPTIPGTVPVFNIYAWRDLNQTSRIDPLYGSLTGGGIKVFSDEAGIAEISIRTSYVDTQIDNFLIFASQPNTPEGSNVTAVADNGSVTFSEVTVPGNTFIVQRDTGDSLPSGVAVCAPWPAPPFYMVETNADTGDPDIVCVNYPDTCDESSISLYGWQMTIVCGPPPCGCLCPSYEYQWGDVTTSVNTATNTICGETGSKPFGPFVVVHAVADNDGDGYSTGGSASDDCDDTDASVHPGAIETCNGKDSDCDGLIDGGLSADADGDGHYAVGSCAAPADDCDDDNRFRFAGHPEVCDGLDNNCDGLIDNGLFVDNDGDGHYTPGSCAMPADDCNDDNPGVWGCNTAVSPVPITIDAGESVKVTFPFVTTRGHTSAESTICDLTAPEGYRLIPFDNPTCYDIQSTAAYGNPVEICIAYDDTGLQDYESSMRILQCDPSLPTCIVLTTLKHNLFQDTICAESSGFSLFALAVDIVDTDNDGVADSVDNCINDENLFQEDFDGDHIGDVCDSDIDNDGVTNDVDMCPQSAPGSSVDETGCADSLEDNDGDGFTNQQERNALSNPDDPYSIPGITSLHLHKGFNLVSFPADPMYFNRLYNFMEVNGGSEVFSNISIFDPVEQIYIEGGYDATDQFVGLNPEFEPHRDYSGMIIYAKKDTNLAFTSKYCRIWYLKPGVNLVGSACLPQDMTAFKLLQKLGGSDFVSVIQRYNTETGTFESAGYHNGQLAGPDFNIVPGEGYFIFMRQELNGFDPAADSCEMQNCYRDSDSDGYGNPDDLLESCECPTGYVTDNTDCDDGNADVNSGAPEYCVNGLDEDCDGYIDDEDVQCTESEPPSFDGLESAVLDCLASPVEIDLVWPPATDNMTPPEHIRYVVCWDDEPLTYAGGADCVILRGETTYSVNSHFGNGLLEDQVYYLGVTPYDIAANGAFNNVVIPVMVNCVP